MHPRSFDAGNTLPLDSQAISRSPAWQSPWKARPTVLKPGIADEPISVRDDAVHHGQSLAEPENGERAPGRLRLFPYSGQEFDGFLQSASDPVVIADRDGWIICVNAQAEKLFGYLPRELVGRKVEMLIPELNQERHISLLENCLARPSARPPARCEQLSALRKNGRPFPADIQFSLLSTRNEFVIVCAIRDVTGYSGMVDELRKQVQELTAADRNKDEFLGMLAHELRNPLAAIRNTVYVLKNSAALDVQLRWTPDMIDRQINHMARLVEELLDVSRIAQGKFGIRKELVLLDEIVGQAVETCTHLVIKRKQQLTVALPVRAVTLLADRTRLVQVFTNLLNNSTKYTQDGGTIGLTATEDENELVVRVRDNGIGMNEEMLPRVFDLFTQIPEAIDRSEGGLGIGLATVRHLVLLHGGTVQALSDGPGRGSEFVVRLPIISTTPAAIENTENMGQTSE